MLSIGPGASTPMMSAPPSARRTAWPRPCPRAMPVMKATLPATRPAMVPPRLFHNGNGALRARCRAVARVLLPARRDLAGGQGVIPIVVKLVDIRRDGVAASVPGALAGVDNALHGSSLSGGDAPGDRLGLQELPQAVLAPLPAETALLIPAERRVRAEAAAPAVQDHRAGAQLARDVVRADRVTGPYAAAEAELALVGEAHGLVLRPERDHDADRAEELPLRALHRVAAASEQRPLDE